ncbi:MAG: hypothetical protein DMG68_14950 [Acidobacteria bacterium]|nr:MAG: hypothetical protein DMG68_14950 [Acidobacteriota bacterium]
MLQQQSALTQAKSTLVGAKASYEKARVELDRATGLTLTRLGIDVADAERGQVTHMPNVPYVAPRQETPANPNQPAPTQPPATQPPATPPPQS